MATARMQTGMGSASSARASTRVAPASHAASPVVVAAAPRCPASSLAAPVVWGSSAPQRPLPPLRAPPCRATLDSPEIAPLVEAMVAARPAQTSRDQLTKCLSLIDDINSKDPSQVEWGGKRHPYRQLFGHWLSEQVTQLDPGAPDELFILARGKNIESWRLSEIKRDDYSPNSIGQKQWEQDRKAWLARRLTDVMRSAGYSEASSKLVEDFMLGRDLPDPRDVRLYDVTGPMGATNYRLLELLQMVQTLRDAEALVFLDKTFPRMFEELPADEVLAAVKRELAGVSKKCLATALSKPWPPLARKLLGRALPAPPGWGDVLREVEGVAAASSHPGDWRYKDFDYE